MKLIKTELSTILNELEYPSFQRGSENLATFPALVYYIAGDDITRDFSKEIRKQEFEVIIDIWADDSIQLDTVMSELEELMKLNNWYLSYEADIIDQSDKFHKFTRFRNYP